MSQTYELCCETCKEHLWIGQGHASSLYVYTGELDTMTYMDEFMSKHLSTRDEKHALVLLDSNDVPEDWLGDIRVFGNEPRWHWWFTPPTLHNDQELVEQKGRCLTDFHDFKGKTMLEVVKILTGNYWRLTQVNQEEIIS